MNQKPVSYHAKLIPFIQYMESLTGRPNLDEVIEKLDDLEITVSELAENVQFHSNSYGRVLMFENEHVQLLCLCWKSGQRSPIHDHSESICGVKIITGVASETVYEVSPSGFIKATSTIDYGEGTVGSQDDDIHQIANLQAADQDLVTLHCYAPPLRRMQTFSLDSKLAQIYQPINER